MCPATKKITDQIAEDMRAQYEAGEATQAELADLFNVSVPTVNKTVKGVTPVKRKYKKNKAKEQRDATIVAEYDPDNGVGMRELSEKYEMTYQNVSLILKSAGVSPRQEYFSKLREQSSQRKETLAQEVQAKQVAKKEKLQKLSQMWISGCTINEFRAEAGLKSANAAQVKIVHLRKKHGDTMFPRRNVRNTLSAEDREAKVAELSRLYMEDPTNLTALAAVFGEKESSVQRRICDLRKSEENGEDLFPRRRKARKAKVVPEVPEAAEEEKENVEDDTVDFISEQVEVTEAK